MARFVIDPGATLELASAAVDVAPTASATHRLSGATC